MLVFTNFMATRSETLIYEKCGPGTEARTCEECEDEHGGWPAQLPAPGRARPCPAQELGFLFGDGCNKSDIFR